MIKSAGEGLIECRDCGAMVPSFAGLIDAPGTPEHLTPCFRPVTDATMHNLGCNYCLSPEKTEYFAPFIEFFERQDRERNARTIGDLLDSIDDVMNPRFTTEDLVKVAEIGKLLFYGAICTADDVDDDQFFTEAYGSWGPVVDAVLGECGRDYRHS
jgi:hypothetical protein